MPIAIGTALLLSGLASVLGSAMQTGMQAGSQGWSQDFNREEAEKAREFNALEAEKSRGFSADEAEKNRLFEAQQAEITRQWQTDMSNSAYQRSMVDMEKAGINPNLLASGAMGAATGNASTPQGSQAQTSAASGGAASSSPVHYGNMFQGLTNALNAYATIQNQQMIAELYSDTSKANNSFTNTIRRYGIDKQFSASKYRTDRTSANFQQSVWKYRK